MAPWLIARTVKGTHARRTNTERRNQLEDLLFIDETLGNTLETIQMRRGKTTHQTPGAWSHLTFFLRQ
jgi:hypothetical protein